MESIYTYAAALKRNDASCTVVNLNCALIGNDGLKRLAMALQDNTHLVVLFLNQNGFRHYPQTTTTTTTKASLSSWQLFCQAVAQHPRLQYLYLSSNPDLQKGGLAVLFDEMAKARNGQLKVLKLSDCCCSTSSDHDNDSHVRRQHLQHQGQNDDDDDDDDTQMTRALSAWLRQPHCALQTLSLDHNHDLNLTVLLQGLARDALPYNTSLQTLDIESNRLQRHEWQHEHNQQQQQHSSPCVWKELVAVLQQGHNKTLYVVRRRNVVAASTNLHDDQMTTTTSASCGCTCVSCQRDCHNNNNNHYVTTQELLSYYLTLNSWGRQHFGTANLPAAAWTHVLGKAANPSKKSSSTTNGSTMLPSRASLLYHVVRSRPDLLEYRTANSTTRITDNADTTAMRHVDAPTTIGTMANKKRRLLLCGTNACMT